MLPRPSAYSRAMLSSQDLIDIGLARDLQVLTERVVAAAGNLGYGLVSGVLVRGRFGSESAVLTSFGNPPEAFLESSKSLDEGLRDPLLAQLLSRPGHVSYDQDFYARSGAADLWDCQAAYGYKSGLSLALHAPSHGEAFLFGIDGPSALPSRAEDQLRLRAVLQTLALHAQAAVVRLATPGLPPVAPELDAREVSALGRAAAVVYSKRGGLVQVAGQPDPDLKRAATKLGTSSASRAILRAIEVGLIQR